LFAPKPDGGAAPTLIETAAYDHRSLDGLLRFQAVRYTPKQFRQRRPDGAGGWIWKRAHACRARSLSAPGTRRPLVLRDSGRRTRCRSFVDDRAPGHNEYRRREEVGHGRDEESRRSWRHSRSHHSGQRPAWEETRHERRDDKSAERLEEIMVALGYEKKQARGLRGDRDSMKRWCLKDPVLARPAAGGSASPQQISLP
jgi:hypothetical protein